MRKPASKPRPATPAARSPRAGKLKLVVRPLTPARWLDLEKLFGERGACGGCWCMYWRLPHSQWLRQKGQGNKNAFRRLVQSPSGPPPGLIVYLGKEPVGWCALAPREQYPRFNKSRVLAPVDDRAVWSITCFFVARAYRRRGISLSLLREAVKFASRQGGQILEGYPWEARAGYPDVFYYTGQVSTFRRAGFKEVLRRSPVRPIMRHAL